MFPLMVRVSLQLENTTGIAGIRIGVTLNTLLGRAACTTGHPWYGKLRGHSSGLTMPSRPMWLLRPGYPLLCGSPELPEGSIAIHNPVF